MPVDLPLSVVAGLVGLQALYWLCVGPLRDRFAGAQPVSAARRLLFAEGVVVLLLALASPLHALSDRYLFSAHMLQHLLITLVAAPLLLAGTPGWLLRELLAATRTTRLVRWAMHPLVAFGLFNLVFALAHLPAIYELALSAEPLHATEHLLFLLTGLLLWLPVLSPQPGPLPRYPDAAQVVYLLAQTLPAMLVGALLSTSGQALIPTYIDAPRVTPLSPWQDQQVGGLLMWVGGGVYWVAAAGIVFFRWAGREEAANRRPLGPTSLPHPGSAVNRP